MTMKTRCSKVILPNYSKTKPAEDTLVPPLWGTRGKNVRLWGERFRRHDNSSKQQQSPSINFAVAVVVVALVHSL